MTITYHGGNILRGTTAERTGGTWTTLPDGWIFIESNGLKVYRWNTSTWDLLTSTVITDLSGTLALTHGGTGQTTATASFDALSPMTTLGDIIYGGASGTRTALAGNIHIPQKVLAQTGTGAASAAPAWVTPAGVYSSGRKWGAFVPVASNGSVGLFQSNQSNTATGSTYTIRYDNTYGRVFEAATGASANNTAGWRSGITLCSLGMNPRYWCRFKLLTYTGTSPQLFAGLQSANAHTTGDDYLNALSGVALGLRSTDSAFQITYNEGTGASNWEAAVPATNIDTAWHTFDLWGDTANNKWVYQLDGGAVTVVNTGAPTTQVPVTNTAMAAQITLSTSDANAKTMQVSTYVLETG